MELLVEHGVWLRRGEFVGRFVHRWEEAAGEPELASVDWRAAVGALESGGLPCSGSEAAVLRVAASIADGVVVDLGDVVSCVDRRNADLVAAAVLHAAGCRDLATAVLAGERR